MANWSGRVGFGLGRAGLGQFDQTNFRVTGRVGSERVGFRVDSDRPLSGYGSGRVKPGRVSGQQYSLLSGHGSVRVKTGRVGSPFIGFFYVQFFIYFEFGSFRVGSGCLIAVQIGFRVDSGRVESGFGLSNSCSCRVSGCFGSGRVGFG